MQLKLKQDALWRICEALSHAQGPGHTGIEACAAEQTRWAVEDELAFEESRSISGSVDDLLRDLADDLGENCAINSPENISSSSFEQKVDNWTKKPSSQHLIAYIMYDLQAIS